MPQPRYIGEILVEEGLIKPEHLQEALSVQKKQIGQILVERGYIKAEDLDRALQLQVGIARSERYQRLFRSVLAVALLMTLGLGLMFVRANRQAQFLERLGDGALTLPELREILTGEGSKYKLEALRSLERYAPGEREEILIHAVQSDDWFVRLFAVLFVHKYGGDAYVAHLVPLTLAEEEATVRHAALEALKAVTGQDLGQGFNDWYGWAKGRGVKVVFPARLRQPPVTAP